MKRSRAFSFPVFIVAFALGVFMHYLLSPTEQNLPAEGLPNETKSEISTLTKLNNETYVQILPNKITLNAGPFDSDLKSVVLDHTNYPKLFDSDNEREFITVEGITDGINKKNFVFVKRNLTSAGGFSPKFGLIIDPTTEHLVYETPAAIALAHLPVITMALEGSTIRLELSRSLFNDSCGNCRLEELEFVSYDPNKKKYILANEKFSKEFKELYAQYEKISQSGCRYKGTFMPVADIIKQHGGGAKCDDMMFPTKNESPEYFLTVGRFQERLDTVKKIAEGTNISMLDEKN